MPVHVLPEGRALIEGLVRLGESLGYVAERELPVERLRANPPAVDVAWLAEKGQEYPLMIFEVESRATNSAANNAIKVFGQPNEKFEKPLFFFHVFVAGGVDSSRIETLRTSFGLHNYRTYEINKDEVTRLVLDVLSQHRRLRRKLPTLRLLRALGRTAWRGVDLDTILRHAERLRFEGNFLAAYAQAGISSQPVREHFFRLLRIIFDEPSSHLASYTYVTYLGQTWADPIHIGLLALRDPSSVDWLERLRYWQEKSSFLSMIGPHFGRRQEYDDFVLGLAPVLWALVAAFMSEVQGAAAYIADQNRQVLNRVASDEPVVSFFTAIWMLHIAAAAGLSDAFEWARAYVNERGGIDPSVLYDPPSTISIFEQNAGWRAALATGQVPVPSLTEFRAQIAQPHRTTSDIEGELAELALALLTDERAIYSWSPTVARLLHGRGGSLRAAV